jgi:hypothetical protein
MNSMVPKLIIFTIKTMRFRSLEEGSPSSENKLATRATVRALLRLGLNSKSY